MSRKYYRPNPEPRKWVRTPCRECSAKTVREAEKLCRPNQSPCGEWSCPGNEYEEAPTYFGYLHAPSQEWLDWFYEPSLWEPAP